MIEAPKPKRDPLDTNAEKFRRFFVWFFYIVIVGGGILYHLILFPVRH